jgi:hypothetical protein
MRRSLFLALMLVTTYQASANILYNGDALPIAEGWTIVNYPAYEATALALESGVLHMTDASTVAGSAAHYYRDLSVGASEPGVWAEFDVKAVSSSSGSFFGLERDSTAPYEVALEIGSGVVAPFGGGSGATIVNTDDYHTYRIELESSLYRVFFDGALTLTGAVAGSGATLGSNLRVHFGLGSSAGTAEFYVDEIRAGGLSVPAPLSIFLVLSGIMGLGYSQRMRR